MNKQEVRRSELEMSSAFDKILDNYKNDLKSILELAMEELYGMEDDDRFPGKGEIFNKGVEECIKIVKEL